MLADHMQRERNSFSLLRLIAALAVLVSHSYLVVRGPGPVQPLDGVMPYNLGQHAVHIFFIISGLTLSQSWHRNPDAWMFVVSRVARIFPGLLALGLVFSFAIGLAMTNQDRAAYLVEGHTWSYPLALLLFFEDAVPPHRVFEEARMAGEANVPLWTIKYEVFAYIMFVAVAFCGMLSRLQKSLIMLAMIATIFTLISVHPEFARSFPVLESLARFGTCFMIGVCLYAARDRIPTSPWLLVLLVPLLLSGDEVVAKLLSFLAATVVVLGTSTYGPLTRWASRTDVSYGTYIYGWPIQQVLAVTFPAIGMPLHLLLSLTLVPAAGYISWRLIELPALAAKDRWKRGRPALVPLAEEGASG